MKGESKESRLKINSLVLSDESAHPGPDFCERIAFLDKPLEEDLAILEAWRFRGICLKSGKKHKPNQYIRD